MLKSTLRKVFLILFLLVSGCTTVSDGEEATGAPADDGARVLALPKLEPVSLDGRPLRVVATTSIIGDVVQQVGGEAIELTTLIGPGQEPHSFEPAAQTMTTAAGADIIFVNGWGLEEGLAVDLANLGTAPVVPISAGITPLATADGQIDPHVWWRIDHVRQWAANVAEVLGALDPANQSLYQRQAEVYQAELDILERDVRQELARIPAAQRQIVTSHDALGYFAAEYDFAILGTVLPGPSTLAEPSAADLANLITQMESAGVCTIFTEEGLTSDLIQTVAAELDGCGEVTLLPLYSDALGAARSGADSYVGMVRANVETIANTLK